MNKEKLLQIITSLESILALLKLEVGAEESTEQPSNTISLRELIGSLGETDSEPEYIQEDPED